MLNIEEKIEKTPICWNWTGAISSGGYGSLQKNKVKLCAHRVIYEIYKGKIPDGLELDHLCRNRRCVNPEHLEPITHGENIKRGWPFRFKGVCKWGHKFDDKNTYIHTDKNGRKKRKCRTCRNRIARNRRERGGKN